jgi:septal ring factor EnvC (AmiA/AmiB activator)
MQMNMDISNTKDELERKKKFYEDQANNNKDLNRNITILDQNIADLSLRLNRDDNNRQHFQDELGGLKRTVERTGHDLEKSRIEVAQLKKNISEKRQL